MKTVIDMFLEISERYPDNMAVSDESGGLSYNTLNELSDLISEKIIEGDRASSDGICIGIMIPRKKEIIAVILGVLRSGNHYVFIEPDAPEDRSRYILKDAKVKCLITSNEVSLPEFIVNKCSVFYIEDILKAYAKGETGNNHNLSATERMAYIIYTSGSTGSPKGVMKSHGAIISQINTEKKPYKLKISDCVGNMTSFSFAAVTHYLFSAFTVGCNQYIFSREDILNQSQMIEKIRTNGITTMLMVPGMVPVVLKADARLPLKWVILTGEKIKSFPNVKTTLFESYGLSEAGPVLWHKILKKDPWNLLGKPYPESTVYLLDEAGKLIDKPGVTGEACIVNNALSLGYMNMEEESKKKYTDCPFEQGKRMFHSGDMMWFDEEGNFYFAGRADGMTKINGQRVELGEIEATLAGYRGIEDAVCCKIEINGRDMLVCYYTLIEGTQKVSKDKLVKFLEKKLPGYMVPAEYISLPEFPKNANGKTDRRVLANMSLKPDTENVKPKDDTERIVLDEARRFLTDIEFGVTDDLFKLGMDSITAVRFVAAIESCAPGITVSQVMRKKSIRRMLSEKNEVITYYGKYDENKPILVLLHGNIPIRGLNNVYKQWSTIFNLLVIEPFLDHIYTEVKHYDYDELTDYYFKIVKKKLPKYVNPWGFAGFSFAGDLAITLASKWNEKYNVKPYVFMGDTNLHLIFPGKKLVKITKDFSFIDLVYREDPILQKEGEVYSKQEFADRINRTGDLILTKKSNITYEGPVIYIYALKDANTEFDKIRLNIVKTLYKNIKIIEFPNYNHNELFLKEGSCIMCKNIFRMILNSPKQEG